MVLTTSAGHEATISSRVRRGHHRITGLESCSATNFLPSTANIGLCQTGPMFLLTQGSLRYTPEDCLVNGGVPSFLVENTMFQMGKLYLLRSPADRKGHSHKEVVLPLWGSPILILRNSRNPFRTTIQKAADSIPQRKYQQILVSRNPVSDSCF